MLFIGLIPTAVVSMVGYVTISRVLTSKTNSQVESQGITQHRKLEGLLQKKREDVIKLANQYELQIALNAYVAGGKKQVPRNIDTILYDYKFEKPEMLALYLTDMDGTILSTGSRTGPTGQKTFEPPAYTQAGVGFSIQEDTDGIDKLFITTVIAVNQKDIAKLTVLFRIDDMITTVQDYTGLERTGETIVARADAHNKYTSLFPLRFDTEGALKRDVSSLDLSTTKDVLHEQVTDYRGKQVIVSVKNLTAAGWVVATKIDRDEAFGTIYQLRQKLLYIAIISPICIAAISLYFARFFTRPITMLTEKTRLIMQGDFTQRIIVNTRDEVGTLAAAFNKMTDELDKSYQALENKVAERTKALNQNIQELSDAKAKDEAILDSLGEGMIVSDSNGKVLLVNELAGDLLGLDAASVVGKEFAAELLDESSGTPIPAAERPMEVALHTGQKTSRQVKSIHADGQKFALGITASPVLQQGKVIGSVQIIRDITREKEVDRMKTEFISLASHQLRTPLSAIRWFSEMLVTGDAGELKPEQKEFAQNVYDSTQRMIALVGSLLNISRIESGRIRIDPQPTDVHDLVKGIVNDLKGKTEERKQTIIVSVHDDLPQVNLDARLIGQVYMNLLTNAIKYSPKGGEISVFVSRKDDELVSQVTDNGYGIPKAQQDKMFQKFFRASNVSKVETDGTGLGMYLVKAIIESSGGKIWFESEEGKGTTFWFSLPMSGMQAKEGEVTID